MNPVLTTRGLTRRYGRRTALSDCTITVPSGKVVGLVGPNGAGKSTLLRIAAGALPPTSGEIEVLGGRPGAGPGQLAKVAFVAQDTPVYTGLTVGDHLRFGAKTNPRWDDAMARERLASLGLGLDQRAGRLSGGQRAQLALTMAVAKRPELLILDEPVAALDPLARREFMQSLMAYIAEHEGSVILSSHVVSDLERVCDHLIVLVDSIVRADGEVEDLLAGHHRLTGPRRDTADLPGQVIAESHVGRQSTVILRGPEPEPDPAYEVEKLTLEDLVLAYMSNDPRPALEMA